MRSREMQMTSTLRFHGPVISRAPVTVAPDSRGEMSQLRNIFSWIGLRLMTLVIVALAACCRSDEQP